MCLGYLLYLYYELIIYCQDLNVSETVVVSSIWGCVYLVLAFSASTEGVCGLGFVLLHVVSAAICPHMYYYS